MPPNKRAIIPLWSIFNLIHSNFKKCLSLWLFLRLGLWLVPGWDTSVSLSLVDIWVNRLVRLIQSYIYIPVDLGDPVNPLFDTFGAPVCSQRFGCGIIYSLVQSFTFCQCNLVFVPRTHNAFLSIKLLCWESIRAISEIVAALMAVMHHNFTTTIIIMIIPQFLHPAMGHLSLLEKEVIRKSRHESLFNVIGLIKSHI